MIGLNILKFIVLAGIFGWVGYRDVLDTFEPIGTMMLFFVAIGLWSLRSRISSPGGLAYFSTPMLLAGVALAVVNLAMGSYLNANVNRAAHEMIVAIYGYQKANGQFPDDVTPIVSPEHAQLGRPGKLKYGASFYYIKEEGQFSFGYRLFGSAGKFWDIKQRTFVKATD